MPRALCPYAWCAATLRSSMKDCMAASRDSASVARRIEDGCTVATARIPNGESITSPRCLLTRKAGPITDCAAVDQQPRPDHLDLSLEPRPARPHLPGVGLFVQPPLASDGEPEMLDGVGHVDALAVDAGLFEGLLQQTPRGSDERLALEVLLVARLPAAASLSCSTLWASGGG